MPSLYTDADLVAELRPVADLVPDGALTRLRFRTHSTISATTLNRRFGTWRQALDAAGLGHRYSGRAVSAKMRRDRPGALSDDELIADLRQIRSHTGRPYVTKPDVRQYAKNSERVYIARFGSWPAALAAAGLTIAPTGRSWSNDDLAANLRHLIQLYGRTPVSREMDRPPSMITFDTYRRRFGNLDHAKDALHVT